MKDGDLEQVVRQVQGSVAVLEERNRDLVLLAQLFSLRASRTWGWDRFLSEPEFWENIYDSGLADCQGRCIRDVNEANAACYSSHAEGSTEWQNCRRKALDAAVLCHEPCSAANPPTP